MNRSFFFIALAVVAGGCGIAPIRPEPMSEEASRLAAAALQRLSSGHIGCHPQDIQISAIDAASIGTVLTIPLQSVIWDASCHGESFVCAYSTSAVTLSDGVAYEIACSPTHAPK